MHVFWRYDNGNTLETKVVNSETSKTISVVLSNTSGGKMPWYVAKNALYDTMIKSGTQVHETTIGNVFVFEQQLQFVINTILGQ